MKCRHKFESRRDIKVEYFKEWKEVGSLGLQLVKKEDSTYIRDICVKCGLTIERK